MEQIAVMAVCTIKAALATAGIIAIIGFEYSRILKYAVHC